jgi:acetyl-CoA acyltransferase
MGIAVVAELLAQLGACSTRSAVQQVVYGQVVPSLNGAEHRARDRARGPACRASIEAYSVSRACATSYQSTVSSPRPSSAGPSTAASRAAPTAPATCRSRSREEAGSKALLDASAATTASASGSRPSRGSRPKDLVPVPPALVEFSTGLTMGESAEKMAKENGITRADAGRAFAHAATRLPPRPGPTGASPKEVMHVYVPPERATRRSSRTTSSGKRLRASSLATRSSSRPSTGKLRHDHRRQQLAAHRRRERAAPHARGQGPSPKASSVLGYDPELRLRCLDPAGQMLMGPSVRDAAGARPRGA